MFSARELLRVYEEIAQRSGWAPRPSVEQFELVVCMANSLLAVPEDKPAALFYALGRHPRIFRETWVDFGRLAAGATAFHQGQRLVLSREQARSWLVEIAGQQRTFLEVRDLLTSLMIRFPPSRS